MEPYNQHYQGISKFSYYLLEKKVLIKLLKKQTKTKQNKIAHPTEPCYKLSETVECPKGQLEIAILGVLLQVTSL